MKTSIMLGRYTVIVMIAASLALGVSACKPTPTTTLRAQKANTRPKTAKVQKFPKTTGLYGEVDMYKWGDPAEDTATASAKLGYRVPSAALLDKTMKPVVRLHGNAFAVLYPNGVRISGEPRGADEPALNYSQQVIAENKEIAETGLKEREKLTKVGSYQAKAMEKGFYRIDGDLVPRAAFVIWYQDGVERYLTGPVDMPLSEFLRIANSAL